MRVELTDSQIATLRAAAALQPAERRDAFVTDVLLALDRRGHHYPSDRALANSVRLAVGSVPDIFL